MFKTDTITAISTAVSNSGISIIRISGDEAIEVADKIFYAKRNNKKLKDVKSHTIHYGIIKDGDKDVDEVLVSVMKAPNTYTKEDVVEINCHGGITVTKKNIRLDFKKWRKNSRTRRVYQACIFKWKNRSFPGRGCNGYY